MSSSAVKQTKPANAATGATQPGDRQPTKLLIFAAVILGIACLTIVVDYELVPQRPNSHANRKHEESEQAESGRHDSAEGEAKAEFVEVALGDFSFSNTTALRGVITHVDFRLTALASATQAATLASQIKLNLGRIREVINKIVRHCNLDELEDPNLETIKRLVRENINELLGQKLIVELMINDIRIIQQ